MGSLEIKGIAEIELFSELLSPVDHWSGGDGEGIVTELGKKYLKTCSQNSVTVNSYI